MGFSYNVNVLNQKGSPALYTDIFANRPAAGYQGRLFVSTDTAAIYEDTGTAWTLIANVSSGAGTLQQVTTNGNTSNVGIVISAGGLSTDSLTDTALTSGSVTFAGTGGLISQDNANLFWDDTNNRLGINTNTPGNSLDVHTGGTTPVLALNNTAGSQSAISFLNTSVAKWRIGNTATNTFDIHNFANGLTAISISGTNNAASFNTNILIAQSSTINQLTGYNAISSDSAGVYFWLGTSANRAYFVLSGLTGPRNYTLPDATGTLALTSDLSGYVPYSGATGAVNLGAYNLTVNQVVVGQGAGSGSGNVKCAINSLLSNTTGSSNTSVGSNSLFNNTTGGSNTAVGNAALQSNVSGTQNSAYGASTLINSTGSYNTGIGQGALPSNTTGSNNIGLGAGAGDVTTGSNNIFIGVNSTGTSATASNSTFIGTAATTLTWLGGNLLLGTKTDDGSGTKLQVTGSGKFTGDLILPYSKSLAFNSITNQYVSADSTNLYLGTANSARVTINTSGNVGIGIITPFSTARLQVNTKTDVNLAVQTGTLDTTGVKLNAFNDAASVNIPMEINGSTLYLKTNETNRLTISSIGNIGIGTASFGTDFTRTSCATTSQNILGLVSTDDSSGAGFIQFRNSATTSIGSITRATTTNAVLYNTTSDERLKNDLGIANSNIIDNVIIHDFEWINCNIKDKGVFAQELYTIKPEAVTVGKDDINENGEIEQPWGVDYSKLIPDLIVYCQDLKNTIQQQQRQIESLLQRIELLENK